VLSRRLIDFACVSAKRTACSKKHESSQSGHSMGTSASIDAATGSANVGTRPLHVSDGAGTEPPRGLEPLTFCLQAVRSAVHGGSLGGKPQVNAPSGLTRPPATGNERD
jgi:hypothetical protein